MYLRSLKVTEVKLLRDLELDFTRPDGTPRKWTVLLGENGTCKTTILQAIAMAATGYVRANQLADASSLPNRRSDGSATIEAAFEFGVHQHQQREYPGLEQKPNAPPRVLSRLSIGEGHVIIKGSSRYENLEVSLDPIEEARARNLPLWFVAGYGTSRRLPLPMESERAGDQILARLNPLFDRGRLIGTGFADLLSDPLAYVQLLKTAFIDSGLLPQVSNLELRGRGGVVSSSHLVESHRFDFRVGSEEVRLPATWLSQGYQSTIAWVADLVGQVFLEAGGPVELDHVEGLVLIDELDLHLHPRWQVELVRTLKRVFPRVQFIATTHSPMILPGLSADEVVLLRQNAEGAVVPQTFSTSPAELTATQIYREFFGVTQLFPGELGALLNRYTYLVGDALRSDADQLELEEIAQRLAASGNDPGWIAVPRVSVPEEREDAE